MNKNVCVDLDSVLARYDGWKGVEHIGEPLPGAAEFLRKIQAMGVRVVIHTTRTNANPAISGRENETPESLAARVRAWLDAHGLSYDEIYAGQGKPLAAAYIDDRAVPCLPQSYGRTAYDIAGGLVKNLLRESK